jgi:hypothetical protein
MASNTNYNSMLLPTKKAQVDRESRLKTLVEEKQAKITVENTNFDNKKVLQVKTNINISLPDVDCNILGTHYACFLGDNVWCKK